MHTLTHLVLVDITDLKFVPLRYKELRPMSKANKTRVV